MKAIGEKVLGWFIVQDDDEEEAKKPAPAAAESAVRAGGPDLEAPKTARSVGASSVAGAAGVDRHSLVLLSAASFGEVYRRAGIPEIELDRLTKTLDLVASLPSEASPEMKRTIVEAAASAFGVPIDRIVDTASAALAALERNVADGEARTEAARTSTDEQVRKLTAEIERLRASTETQAATQRVLVQATAHERARIGSVRAFFGR